MWIITCICLTIIQMANCDFTKCVSSLKMDFSTCSLGVRQITNKLKHNIQPCKKHIPLCERGFNISFAHLEPFSHNEFKTLVTQIVKHCCGFCDNINITQTNNNVEFSPSKINTSHIVYPVLGPEDATLLHGYHYAPFWDCGGIYYITMKPTKIALLKHILEACRNLWPLIVVMLLMALIAGFVIWVIETWFDKEMFSRTFLVGLFDGFWWSFISMTTVGYGDKTPKFIISRVFSVIWILVGITICSMYTATLMTEISEAVAPKYPKIMGKTVGVVKERLHHFSVVAKAGGIIVQTEHLHLVPAVKELINKLKNRDINGFVLDKFSYMYVKHTFHSGNNTEYHQFFKSHSLLTEKDYGSKKTYGILFKERDDYEFFNAFFTDNKLVLDTCNNIASNWHNKENGTIEFEGHDIFSPDGGLFIKALTVTCSIIGFIVCFGIFYELLRKKYKCLALAKAYKAKCNTKPKNGCKGFSV